MGILEAKAEAERKTFIKNCIGFDTPRLESETYPDGLDNEFDLEYSAGLTMDIYTPQAAREGHAFLLVHGGAFVYGHKELDKCFGMHLALKSGIRVVNINYTLMPDNDLHGLLSQIMKAVRFIQERLHIEHIHTVGDSAGGYLSLITSMLLNSEVMRKECGLDAHISATADSANMICGLYKTSPRTFAGIYFDREGKMPSYIYDLSKAVTRFGCPRAVLVTGDKDFLEKENIGFEKFLKDAGIPVKFMDAVSADGRDMFHVYPIANPTWPEGEKTIQMISDNANGR